MIKLIYISLLLLSFFECHAAVLDDVLVKYHDFTISTTSTDKIVFFNVKLAPEFGIAADSFDELMKMIAIKNDPLVNRDLTAQQISGLSQKNIIWMQALSSRASGEKGRFPVVPEYKNMYVLRASLALKLTKVALDSWYQESNKFVSPANRKRETHAEGSGHNFADAVADALAKRDEAIIGNFLLTSDKLLNESDFNSKINIEKWLLPQLVDDFDRAFEISSTKIASNAAQEIFRALKRVNVKESPLLTYSDLPDFSRSPGILFSLWEKSSFIGGGDEARVYELKSRIDRPEIGIKQGQSLAVRISERKKDSNLMMGVKEGMTIKYFTMKLSDSLAQLNDEIASFFPRHYGFYFGPAIEKKSSIVFKSEHKKDYVNLYEEMEYFPEDLYLSTDSEFFEFCYGQWAGAVIAGVNTTSDNKAKNYRGIHADYYRIYHLGDNSYLFPPSIIPKRIDLDSIWPLSAEQKNKFYYKCELPFIFQNNLTNLSKKAYGELNKGKTIFEVFSEIFEPYKISTKNPVPTGKPVKHYYMNKNLLTPPQ